MDFLLTKEQQQIQKAAREFARGEFPAVAREYDLNETFPEDILNKARELDLVGLFIPEKFG
ncbi:MAG: acyl-CoA dehydrogenase family protein, partial [Desulfobacteraceae bacterium]|nr:acyl-CoA dehydrogenase family protein [Desulfobacteraceae bacterium]